MNIVDLRPKHKSLFSKQGFYYDWREFDQISFTEFAISRESSTHTHSVSDFKPFWQNPCNFELDLDMEKAMSQIPIYLTDRSASHIKVGYFGRSETVRIPQDEYQDLTAKKKYSIIKIMRDDEEKEEYSEELNMTFDGVVKVVYDLLGCYRRTFLLPYEYSHNCPIENTKPEIFIWIDKIEKYVEERCEVSDGLINYNDPVNKLKQTLITFVILHELSHALMDPYLLGCRDMNNAKKYLRFQRYNSQFYEMKEESLANAMALKLIKEHVGENEWNFLVNYVKNQPFQYALGYDYYETFNESMSEIYINWLESKINNIDYQGAKQWIDYVTGAQPLDKTLLPEREKKLYGNKK